jgi:hypothetical protein
LLTKFVNLHSTNSQIAGRKPDPMGKNKSKSILRNLNAEMMAEQMQHDTCVGGNSENNQTTKYPREQCSGNNNYNNMAIQALTYYNYEVGYFLNNNYNA